MKKGVLLGITISVAVISLLGLIFWIVSSSGPLKKGIDDSGVNNAISPFLKDAVQLEKLKSDRSAKAEEKLAELASKKDAVGYYANVALAERYSNKGKDPVPYYRQALELYDTKEIRSLLASSLERLGNYQEAAGIYGSLLPDDASLSSLINLKIGPQAIGAILLRNNQWQEAANYLKSEIDKTVGDTGRAELEAQYARALAEMGKYNEALPILERLNASNQLDTETKWWYGRSLENAGRKDKAKDIYASLGESGAYRLGVLLENEGKLKEAAASYIKSNDADSRWRGARLFEEAGEEDKALDVYLSFSREKGAYQDDGAYRAYVLITRKKSPGSDEMLSIISKYPAWMARLNKQPAWENMTQSTYSKPEFLERVEAYKKSGRQQMAQVELSIGEKNAGLQEKLALGDWYMAQENLSQAAIWGIKALNEQPDRHAYELAYQRPFNEQVRKAAAEFNVDSDLLWALMREESYFKYDAVSRVGALGLMQLMPSTANDIASRLKVNMNERDLLNPDINIRFGASYISSMLKMFSGDMDKALAAYNGGAGNVMKWNNSKLGRTKVDFPTAVTFMETREYITKVANSYYTYKMLYGNK